MMRRRTVPEQKELKVILIRHTLSPEETIALGAKLCYSKSTIDDLNSKVQEKDQNQFIERLLGMGHESVFEHAVFTFGIEGVSRVLLAQLTRHRMASFSVQSQRYVSYEQGFGYILPPRIAALGQEAVEEYRREMEQMQIWYRQWQKRLEKGEGGNEDARFVLPNACETRLMLTMNARELRHFFSLRMCNSGKSGNWRPGCMNSAWRRLLPCLRTRVPHACAENARKGRKPADGWRRSGKPGGNSWKSWA